MDMSGGGGMIAVSVSRTGGSPVPVERALRRLGVVEPSTYRFGTLTVATWVHSVRSSTQAGWSSSTRWRGPAMVMSTRGP